MKTTQIICDYCGKTTENGGAKRLNSYMGLDHLSNGLNVFFRTSDDKDICEKCLYRAVNNMYWNLDKKFRFDKKVEINS